MGILYEIGGGGGHEMSPTPSSSLTERQIVDTINAAQLTPASEQVASLYGISEWTNKKTVRRIMVGTTPIGSASIGSTGIGKWTHKDVSEIVASDETNWWYDDAFVIPTYYMLTRDSDIVSGKKYYTRSVSEPYTYTEVANPVQSALSTYYEQYSDDIDISIKFDPEGDTIVLGGYILDTTTGKICIKFSNKIDPSTARVAVDITYTRNEIG